MESEISLISRAGFVSIFISVLGNELIKSFILPIETFLSLTWLRKIDTLLKISPESQGDIEAGLNRLISVILLLISLVNSVLYKHQFQTTQN